MRVIIIKIAEMVVTSIIKGVTPMIKKRLRDLIEDLELKAYATTNKIDNKLVDVLRQIFAALWEE